jgi:beta-mannosidase
MAGSSQVRLASGWSLKAKDAPDEAWMPVAKVPSQVHVELIANEKYVSPDLSLQ